MLFPSATPNTTLISDRNQGWRPAAGAPDPLAGLLLGQWEADKITGLTNNAPVPSWPNIGTAGVGNNMVQSTSSLRPLWLAADSAFNNKPSVLFDAIDDGMTCGLSLANPYTIIFVARAVDASIQTANRTVNSEDHNALISINRSGGAAVYNEGQALFSTSANGTTAHVMSVAVGTQILVYIDGVLQTIGASMSPTGDWGRISLGASGANAEPANAAIAAVGVFPAVNDTTRQLIESTWKAKYGTP